MTAVCIEGVCRGQQLRLQLKAGNPADGRRLVTVKRDVLFVAGCEENQVRFHPEFDVIILLSAPAEVLAELATRCRVAGPCCRSPTAGL